MLERGGREDREADSDVYMSLARELGVVDPRPLVLRLVPSPRATEGVEMCAVMGLPCWKDMIRVNRYDGYIIESVVGVSQCQIRPLLWCKSGTIIALLYYRS